MRKVMVYKLGNLFVSQKLVNVMPYLIKPVIVVHKSVLLNILIFNYRIATLNVWISNH